MTKVNQICKNEFCCYVPGCNFQQFRPGAGKRIPTGGYIAWGMHYTPIGKAVADRTRVGLWFQSEMTHEIVEIRRIVISSGGGRPIRCRINALYVDLRVGARRAREYGREALLWIVEISGTPDVP